MHAVKHVERQPQKKGCKADMKVEIAKQSPHCPEPAKPRGWHSWLFVVIVSHSNTVLTAVKFSGIVLAGPSSAWALAVVML